MEIDSPKPKPALYTRVFWFLVGAAINYILIAVPFKYFTDHTSWPDWAKAACSLAISTSIFFPWNYFVNFRTDARKRDAFPRYLAVVLVIYAISTTLLSIFKGVDAGMPPLRIGSHVLDLDVITMQLCLGWVKFLVYHKWAFPEAKEPSAG
jgi:hypothetical protein